jgi:hypothetical protein
MVAASTKGAIAIDERRDRPEVTHFEVLQLLLMPWPTTVGFGVPTWHCAHQVLWFEQVAFAGRALGRRVAGYPGSFRPSRAPRPPVHPGPVAAARPDPGRRRPASIGVAGRRPGRADPPTPRPLPRKVRLTVMRNRRTPARASGAWNTGLDQLHRDHRQPDLVFVAVLDDDDAWEPNHLANCLDGAIAGDLNMVASGLIRHSLTDDAGHPHAIPSHLDPEELFVRGQHIQGSNLFVRLDLLLLAGGFDERLPSPARIATSACGSLACPSFGSDPCKGTPSTTTPTPALTASRLQVRRPSWRDSPGS